MVPKICGSKVLKACQQENYKLNIPVNISDLIQGMCILPCALRENKYLK